MTQFAKFNAQKYIYDVLNNSYVKAKKGDKKRLKKEFKEGSLLLFDSKKEMEYYFLLKELENKGVIHNLVLQPVYTLIKAFVDNTGKKQRRMEYIADFEYTNSNEETITVDVKGFVTSDAKLKRKLFLLVYYDSYRLMWVKYDSKEKSWGGYDEVEKRIRKRKKVKKDAETIK